MKLLADHDVYFVTVDFLRRRGHDVVTVKELGLQRASDDILLRETLARGRVLLTRDKGFGALAFLRRLQAGGVIFLRMAPTDVDEIHKELLRVLHEHSEECLQRSFCTVERNRHRIRALG